VCGEVFVFIQTRTFLLSLCLFQGKGAQRPQGRTGDDDGDEAPNAPEKLAAPPTDKKKKQQPFVADPHSQNAAHFPRPPIGFPLIQKH
jgi:hypothetical protein